MLAAITPIQDYFGKFLLLHELATLERACRFKYLDKARHTDIARPDQVRILQNVTQNLAAFRSLERLHLTSINRNLLNNPYSDKKIDLHVSLDEFKCDGGVITAESRIRARRVLLTGCNFSTNVFDLAALEVLRLKAPIVGRIMVTKPTIDLSDAGNLRELLFLAPVMSNGAYATTKIDLIFGAVEKLAIEGARIKTLDLSKCVSITMSDVVAPNGLQILGYERAAVKELAIARSSFGSILVRHLYNCPMERVKFGQDAGITCCDLWHLPAWRVKVARFDTSGLAGPIFDYLPKELDELVIQKSPGVEAAFRARAAEMKIGHFSAINCTELTIDDVNAATIGTLTISSCRNIDPAAVHAKVHDITPVAKEECDDAEFLNRYMRRELYDEMNELIYEEKTQYVPEQLHVPRPRERDPFFSRVTGVLSRDEIEGHFMNQPMYEEPGPSIFDYE